MGRWDLLMMRTSWLSCHRGIGVYAVAVLGARRGLLREKLSRYPFLDLFSAHGSWVTVQIGLHGR